MEMFTNTTLCQLLQALLSASHIISAEESTELLILRLFGFFQRKKLMHFKIDDLTPSYTDKFNTYFKT